MAPGGIVASAMRAGKRPPTVVLRERFCDPCHEYFHLCPCCDHGDRYCSAHCRNAAQAEKHRGAVLRNQGDAVGKARHNERQRRYRSRKRQIVTDHGAALSGPFADAPPAISPMGLTSSAPEIAGRTSPDEASHPPTSRKRRLTTREPATRTFAPGSCVRCGQR